MSDVNKLRSDVEWWRRELEIRQRAVTEALRTLEDRQRELTQAEREEADRISQKTS